MAEIHDLLAADAHNTPATLRYLAEFHPRLPEALEYAATMYDTFAHCMEGVFADRVHLQTLSDCAATLRVNEDALLARLDAENVYDPVIERARTAYRSMKAARVRVLIFLMLQRQYMWAASDLLRMRVTPAVGYARQQAEAMSLLYLMRDDAQIAERWIHLRTDEEGRRFFRETRDGVDREIQRLGLSMAYEQGSGSSLHVRFAGAIRGVVASSRAMQEQWTQALHLQYQEFDPEDQFLFFLDVLWFLGNQSRIFGSLKQAFPEVTDPIWDERVRAFGRDLHLLWQRLVTLYPDRCRALRGIPPAGA